MNPAPPFRSLILGVGNDMRGDDAVGRVVARRLSLRPSINAVVRECGGDGFEIMEHWREFHRVFVVDASVGTYHAGAILRFDVPRERVPGEFFRCSTHAFGLAEAIEMSRVLGTLPDECVLYAVEGTDFRPDQALSLAVDRAADEVCRRICNDLARPLTPAYA